MMPLSQEMSEELDATVKRLSAMLVPLQTPEGVEMDPESKEEVSRRKIWRAAKELDNLLDQGRIPADLDLTKDTPENQQILYEMVVREHFSVKLLEDEGDVDVPLHTPEQCDLQVFFLHGRWFATWNKLDEDMDRPEEQTRELLRIKRGADGALVFNDV